MNLEEEIEKIVLSKVDSIKKKIEDKCHQLGEPDYNGENHIEGIHWKELADEMNKIIHEELIEEK